MRELGQHFLINKSAIKKIVAVLDLQPKDTIIEIGPGRGELTLPIAEECQKLGCQLIAIEKDPALAKNLEFRIKNLGLKIKIINGDILKILPRPKSYILDSKSYKLVGNIPYYITGKLLRILSELKTKPKLTVLMLQKEVAKRIVAKPPKMNLLAAAVQFWAEAKLIFTLKPNDFNPPPEIESAVITLYPKPYTLNPKNYYQMIRIIFKQPRKTLLNNLKSGLPVRQASLKIAPEKIEKALKTLKIDPQSRPQNLSTEDCSQLARLLML